MKKNDLAFNFTFIGMFIFLSVKLELCMLFGHTKTANHTIGSHKEGQDFHHSDVISIYASDTLVYSFIG